MIIKNSVVCRIANSKGWLFLSAIILNAALETESRPYSNESQNILLLSVCVSTRWCTCRRAVLSSAVCQMGMLGAGGVLHPVESLGAPLRVPLGVQGSGALTQGTSWSCSPYTMWFPPINRAEASNSEAVTLQHTGTHILCNSSLYWTTPQVHEQSPCEGDPGSRQRSQRVAGVLRAPTLTWAAQGTRADLSFNGVKRSCSWKLRVRCTHRNLTFDT